MLKILKNPLMLKNIEHLGHWFFFFNLWSSVVLLPLASLVRFLFLDAHNETPTLRTALVLNTKLIWQLMNILQSLWQTAGSSALSEKRWFPYWFLLRKCVEWRRRIGLALWTHSDTQSCKMNDQAIKSAVCGRVLWFYEVMIRNRGKISPTQILFHLFLFLMF